MAKKLSGCPFVSFSRCGKGLSFVQSSKGGRRERSLINVSTLARREDRVKRAYRARVVLFPTLRQVLHTCRA